MRVVGNKSRFFVRYSRRAYESIMSVQPPSATFDFLTKQDGSKISIVRNAPYYILSTQDEINNRVVFMDYLICVDIDYFVDTCGRFSIIREKEMIFNNEAKVNEFIENFLEGADENS